MAKDGTDDEGHPATDFPCATGVPLLALADSKVAEINEDPFDSKGYGLYVVLAVSISDPTISTTTVGVNGLADPLPGSHVSGYTFAKNLGKRADGTDKIHWGVDLSYPDYQNKWIYAMHDGKVEFAEFLDPNTAQAGDWWVSGETVAIRGQTADGHEIWTCYGHGATGTYQVKPGQEIKAGQPLMQMGNTGLTGGAYHLHLCMKIDGKWVDPMTYVNEIRDHPVADSAITSGEEYELNTSNDENIVPTPLP
jgi:murein DD-endopeptidase MepM/ murein hydrolase activator NlpD